MGLTSSGRKAKRGFRKSYGSRRGKTIFYKWLRKKSPSKRSKFCYKRR